MGVFFTSDLHLDHRKVAGLRGFDSPGEHDARIEQQWGETVRPQDTVWVLGDLSISSSLPRLERVLKRIESWPGTKHLVLGNHDPAHPQFRDAHRFQLLYFGAFTSVQAYARCRINGVEAMMSHYPYSGDHTPQDRDVQYRLRDDGRWLLHGHLHCVEKITGPRQLHVGLDAWDLRPVAAEELAPLLVAPR